MTDEDGGDTQSDDEGLTYAEAGVDIAASEAATAALLGAVDGVEGEFAGIMPLGDGYLGLATDGVGTKILVARAVHDYTTVGIDCIAMNANDLVAAGVTPVAFVDYLAVAEPDTTVAKSIGEGLQTGAGRADVALLGGETAVMPEVISGVDLAGTCAGIAGEEEVFPGEATVGDILVGFPSSGIHSNGLTLAREAVTRAYDYADPFPPNTDRTIGEELLEPTSLYVDILTPLREHDTHAAAHVTGGGWTNLERMGDNHYVIDDPMDVHPIFDFIQEEGAVSDEEMHRTFNMGTGFVSALAPEDATELVEVVDDAHIIGHVQEGEGVTVRGMAL